MNHVYRSIWNAVTGCYVAVAEVAKAGGRRVAGGRVARRAARPVTQASGPRAVSLPVVRPMALEARLMFDAAAVTAVVEAVQPDAAPVPDVSHAAVLADAAGRLTDSAIRGPAQLTGETNLHTAATVTDRTATALREGDAAAWGGRQEIAFVLDNVADWQSLVQDLPAGVEVVLLHSQGDALEQMADYLAQRSPGGVDAIHLLSHGGDGQLQLGEVTLNNATLADHSQALARIGAALTDSGDLLLYGCDVAHDAQGLQFVGALARATGADLSASADATGAAQLGGNWTLEASIGQRETTVLALERYERLLATPVDGTTQFGSGNLYYGGSGVDASGSGYVVSDIASSGWDFRVFASDGTADVTVNVESFTGETHIAYGATQSGSTNLTAIELSANDGQLFTLRSVDLVVDGINGNSSSGTITVDVVGYRDGSAVSGAVVSQVLSNASAGATLVTVDVSSNAAFVGIDAFRVLPTNGDVINGAIGVDNVDATNFHTANSAPTLANLNGDSVAWAGVGTTVRLDAGSNLTLNDAELAALNGGNGDWAGASFTVQRSGTALSSDTFGFDTAGASFTVSGGNLQSGGLTFATYTVSGGVLTINATSSGTDATTALMQDVASRVTYRSDTPGGDATVRFSLSDGSQATTADVTVTSNTIYVTNTTDTATIDLSNGVSFSEAVALANSQAGTQTLVLDSALANGTLTLAGDLAVSDSLVIDADAASGLTLAGSTLTVAAGQTLTVQNSTGDTLTVSTNLADGGSTSVLSKAGAGTLTLSGANIGRSGTTSITGGVLSINTDNQLDGSNGTVTLNGGTLNVSSAANTTINNAVAIGSNGGTITTVATGAQSVTFSGAFTSSSSVTLTKAGSGNLQFTGATNSTTMQGGIAVTAGNLAFSIGATDAMLAAGTITLDGGGLSTTGVTGLNIDNAIVLGAGGGTVTINGATRSNTLSGAISGTGALTKASGGTLTLSGINSYSGTTTVSFGTLVLSGGSAIGDSSAVTVASGATLSLSASETVGSLAGAGDLQLGSNTLTTGGDNSATTFDGLITGAGDINKQGTGTLTLTNTGNEVSMTGGISVLDGTLSVADAAALPYGTLTLNGGSLTVTAPSYTTITNDIVLGSNGATINAIGQTTLNGVISGSGDLTANGTSFLAFYGDNTYTGTTTVADGILTVGHSHGLGSTAGGTIVLSGATLAMVDNITVAEALSLAGTGVNGTSGALRLGDTTHTGTITLTGDATLTAVGDATLSGAISGAFNVTKEGAGTLTLSGTNSYTGTTSVTAGTLAIGSDANLGAGNVSLSNATLEVSGFSIIDNSIVLASDATLQANGYFDATGVISGTGTLTKTGTGNLVLDGANTYTGNTAITAGYITATNDQSLGTSAGGTTISSGATLHLNNASGVTLADAISVAGTGDDGYGAIRNFQGSSTLSGVVTLTGDARIEADAGNTLVLSGGLTDGAGSYSLTKSLSGNLVLSGTASYDGTTQVSGGTLTVSDDSTLGSGAVTLNGGTLSISNDGTVDNAITLGSNDGTVTTAGAVTLSGAIDGSGGLGKAGSGTVTLSGTNTSTGSTTVTAGTLALSGGSAVADTSAVTVASGATLSLMADETIGSLAGAGSVALSTATLTTGGDHNSTVFSGVVSGAGALTKTGSGSLTLSGSNTYTGATTVSAGELSLESASGTLADTSAVTVATGAALQLFLVDDTVGSLAGAGTVTLNGGTLTVGADNTSTTFSGVLEDGAEAGALIKTGAGTLTLSGTNTYSGTTAVTGGTLSVASDSNLGAGALTLNSGTLHVTGDTTVDNAVALGSNGGTVAVDAGLTASLSGVISGSGALDKQGAGTLALSGTNTYTGDTTVTAGTLSVGSDAQLGGGGLTLGSATTLHVTGNTTIDNAVTLSGNATLQADDSTTLSGLLSGASALTKTGSGTLTLTHTGNAVAMSGSLVLAAGTLAVADDQALPAGAISLNGGVLSVSGATTIDNALSLNVDSFVRNDAALTLSGQLSGGAALTKLGAGTLALSHTGNAAGASGAIEVRAGTLAVASDAVLSAGTVTLNGGTLSLSDGATSDNAISLASGGGTVSVADLANATLSGVIAGSGSLTKTGSGVLTTQGTNTYSGATSVTAGSLLITGSLANTGSVTVNSGATLGGTGSVGAVATSGQVVVDAGGTLAPGVDGLGALTLQDGVRLDEGSSYAADVAGTGAGTGHDQLVVTGTVQLNGGTLSLNLTGLNATVGDTYILINNDGSDAVDGTFDGLAEGATVAGPDGRLLQISYVAGDGNDVGLTALNTTPTSTAIASQNATEDSAFSFTVPSGTFNDLDTGDSLTLSATLANGDALPTWLSFNAATGIFSGTPGNGDVGAIDVRVTATDGSNASVSSDFTLTVSNSNDAPTSIGISAQSATEDSAFNFTVPSGTFNDVDAGDSLTLSATLANGDALPTWLSFNAATGTFSGTPANGDVGAIDVRVTATDDSNASVSSDFTLTVSNTNDAPTSIGISAQSATEDSAFSFTVPSGTFTDVDAGDSLTLSATLANGDALPTWLSFNAATGIFSGTPANGDVGAISVRVTATDGSEASVSSDFTLTVSNANDAPTSIGISAQSATEDSAFSFTVPSGTFTDVDAGDSLTLSAMLANGDALPTWLSFNAATGIFSGTPGNGDVGAIDVRVTATDGSNASVSSDFTLTVSNANDAPTSIGISAQSATEDSAFSFTVPSGTFTDVDAGDSLTLSATLANGDALPTWLSFNAATGIFSGTPANGDVGAISVRVTATDGSEASVSSDFTLTVSNTNDAPTTIGISAQSATEDSAFSFAVPSGTFNDVDSGDSLTLSATLANGDALPTWLSFNAATGTFSGTPTNGDVGAIDVRVTATDSSNASVSSDFTLTVVNTNDAPTSIGISAQSATEESVFSFTVPSGTFTDVDAGDSLTLSAMLANGDALPTWLSFNAATGTFSGTPANGDVGAIDVRVTATDSSEASLSSDFTLTVSNTNDAPTSTGIANQRTMRDSAFSFTVPSGTFSDVDAGDSLTLSATLANGDALPTWLSFNAATGMFSGTPSNGDVGAIDVRVIATDNSEASVSSDFTLTVGSTNEAPTTTGIANQSANEDSAFNFTVPSGTFSDVDAGDSLTLSATLANGDDLPTWLSFHAAIGTFSGTPSNGDVGAIDVRVTATDGSNASVSSDFMLTVRNTNDAPTSMGISAQSATEDSAFNFTVPSGTFSDVDAGDSLTLSATLANGDDLPTWLSFHAATGTFSGTPSNGDVGAIDVRVTATDSSEARVSSDFTLTVAGNADPTPVNHVPVLAQPDGLSVVLTDTDQADNFQPQAGQVQATDADGTALQFSLDGGHSVGATVMAGQTYDLQKVGDVGTLWLNSTTGQYVFVPAEAAVNAASHAVQEVFGLSVSDGEATVTTRLTVQVAGVDDVAQGVVAVTGRAEVGQVLQATAAVSDAEGVLSSSLRWQMQDTNGQWADVAGAQGATLVLTNAQSGHAVRAVVLVSDAAGGHSEVVSTATEAVAALPVPAPSLPVIATPPPVPVPPAPPLPTPDVSPSVSGFLRNDGGTGGGLGGGVGGGLNGGVDALPSLSGDTGSGSGGASAGDASPRPGQRPAVSSLGQGDVSLTALPSLGRVTVDSRATLQFTLPTDTFRSSDANAAISIEMRLSNGRPLPGWLRFDPRTGTLSGQAPAGFSGRIQIEVVARDANGRQAVTHLDVDVDRGVTDIPPPPGRTSSEAPRPGPALAARPSLSEQIRSAGARHTLSERLAGASRAGQAGTVRG